MIWNVAVFSGFRYIGYRDSRRVFSSDTHSYCDIALVDICCASTLLTERENCAIVLLWKCYEGGLR